MRNIALSIALFFVPIASAHAQAPRDCGSLWKEADVDGNGSLTKEEDSFGYLDAVAVAKFQTIEPSSLSRDEFMLFCDGTLERSSAGTRQHKGSEGPIDRGKGDLTPGLIPFPKHEARKRLEASGYRELDELKLDEKGIWRTFATFNGKRVPAAVDVQGDILAGP